VVMTPQAQGSRWVQREITEAENLGKAIVPLLLEGSRFFSLSDYQYEDVRHGQMPSAKFVGHLKSLVLDSEPDEFLTNKGTTSPDPPSIPVDTRPSPPKPAPTSAVRAPSRSATVPATTRRQPARSRVRLRAILAIFIVAVVLGAGIAFGDRLIERWSRFPDY